MVAVAMGRHHSAVIVEAGHVYTFGRNTEGQLGTGNVKAFHAPMELKSLAHVSINVRFLLVVVFFLLLFFSLSNVKFNKTLIIPQGAILL